MKRMAFVFLCLLAFGCGACRGVSPADEETAIPGVETPLETGQPVDISAALMALIPEAQAGLDQPLSASWVMETLKGTLNSSPAAEILGQQLIDDLVDAIDEFQQELLASISGGSGRLAALANPARNEDGGKHVQGQRSFDEGGFSGSMVVDISVEEQGDRVVTSGQVSIQVQGTTPDTIDQVLELSFSYQGDQDACPTAEGETAGSFSGSSSFIIYGPNKSFVRNLTGQISMEAYNKDDGTLDQANLIFESSINYNANDQTWGTSITSQASGVNPKDRNSVLSQLAMNHSPFSLPPADMHISVDSFTNAYLDAIQLPMATMITGTEAAEELWLTANRCVEITATPEELHLDPGDSEEVEVEVTLKADGGSLAADISAWVIGRGQIHPEQANSSPGAKANFTYTAPDKGFPDPFTLFATSKAGKASKDVEVSFPKIEWSGTFTMAGSSNIKDVGSSQGTTTFTIRFQADLNQPLSAAGNKILVPFELEDGASMTWSGTATALGITQSFSGTTSNIITPNYANPEWVLSLPDANSLTGEGYVDLSEKKLYLFLLGIGDRTGYGTFNLSPNTTCSYYQDQSTNRVYLVFPLDDEYKIADGSCSDRVSGDMSVQSTRSWHFETRYVSEE